MSKVLVLLLVVVLLAAVVGGGVFAYFQFFAGPSRVGPMAGGALALPADAALVAGFDAKAFLASAGYKQIATGQIPGLEKALSAEEAEKTQKEIREGLEKGLAEAETKVGIRFDRDVDGLVVGVSKVGGAQPEVAVMAFGRFDRAKVTGAVTASLEAEGETLTQKTVEGVVVHVASAKGQPVAALAFLDDATLVAGQSGAVEAVVASHAKGSRPLETNQSLLTLVKGLDPASGYWIVVDQPLLQRAQKEAGAGAALPVPLPSNLTLAGQFDGGFALAAEMADDASAKNVADLVQGGLGAARMQAAQNPEIQKVPGAKELLEGIQVQAEGKKVTLSIGAPGGGAGMAGVVAAIAIPSLLRARVSANEAGVIGDIRTVVSAEAAYASASPGGSYGDLGCLAEPKGCLDAYEGPFFLDAELAKATEKNGYKRSFHPGAAGQRPRSYAAYAYTATPLTQGRTGVRSFCGDASGMICFDPNGQEIVPQDGACPVPASCTPLQ